MFLAPFAALQLDPTWPWSIPALGWPLFFAVAGLLTALTVWTYTGVKEAPFPRLLTVLLLRLGALLIAWLLVLRPSYAQRDEAAIPSRLLIFIDSSLSMNTADEFNGNTRWAQARNLLESPAVKQLLKELEQDHKIEIVYYQGDSDIRKYERDGAATGKRTDFGRWLNTLRKTHGGDRNLRGLLIFSDGADNGTEFNVDAEAGHWRNLPCPIHPFALGSPNTTLRQQDIALAAIHPHPPQVPVKNKVTIRAVINAPGFENQTVRVKLLIDDKVVAVEDRQLTRRDQNNVLIGEYRPEKAGELKVTVQVEPVKGEVTHLNNEMTTYVTVSAEGLSVLWVERGKRAWEPATVINHVLALDPRISVFYVERDQDKPLPIEQKDWFRFKEKHYDVIIIGDMTASQFCGGDPSVFTQLKDLVFKGTGLLMLGGHKTFGNSDWQEDKYKDIAALLPVELTGEQPPLKGQTRLKATEAGMQHYVARLDERDNMAVWNSIFDPLEEMPRLGKKRPDAVVLVETESDEPVLVGRAYGKGRVLAFAPDTTWKVWRKSEEAVVAYERFWRQMVLWLAYQENVEGSVWVKPDTRRLQLDAPRSELARKKPQGFSAGVRGKGNIDLKNAKFKDAVIHGPNKEKFTVPIFQDTGEDRGAFPKFTEPGEYLIEVEGEATDVDGKQVKGRASARFMCYATDRENLEPAANHEFLKGLASRGGGAFRLAGETELIQFLSELRDQPLPQSRPKAEVWPDWRRTPVSGSPPEQLGALLASGLLPCLLLFCACICTEWFLRRRWGMV
jgi:uncharacterized membrane protein